MRLVPRAPPTISAASTLLMTILVMHARSTTITALVTTMNAMPSSNFRPAQHDPSSSSSIGTAKTAPSYSKCRAATRWDKHLELARSAHRRRHWSQVRLLCTRVISVADDWSAVEQAHLRLALAEQKDKQVDAARRAFQKGTAACPSSDTLFMAWALMESKLHDARSRKVARALLRRAVALNPKRHAAVLAWGVFLEWKQAGEAAVEAVRSVISNGQPVLSASTATTSPPTSATVTFTPTPKHDDNLSFDFNTETTVTSTTTTTINRHNRATSLPAKEFVAYWGKKRSEQRESILADELLTLCNSRVGRGEARESSTVVPRMCEVIGQLEERGGGDVGGGTEGRALAGGWRLAFTTCTVCDRVLTRAGSEVCERLSPPIQEITPRPGEPPVPFRCEVLVRPHGCEGDGRGTDSAKSSPPAATGLTHFLRGWAQARSMTCEKTGRRYVSLRQQVAPRTVTRATNANNFNDQTLQRRANNDDFVSPTVEGSSSDNYRDVSYGNAAVSAQKLPPAVFCALGKVARGGRGLEKLVTQEVTYVGLKLRIGRSREGDMFVYERCSCTWPEDK